MSVFIQFMILYKYQRDIKNKHMYKDRDNSLHKKKNQLKTN